MKLFLSLYILLFLILVLTACDTSYSRREVDSDCSQRMYACTKKYLKADECYNFVNMPCNQGNVCKARTEISTHASTKRDAKKRWSK